jgi:hypothetical protein
MFIYLVLTKRRVSAPPQAASSAVGFSLHIHFAEETISLVWDSSVWRKNFFRVWGVAHGG